MFLDVVFVDIIYIYSIIMFKNVVLYNNFFLKEKKFFVEMENNLYCKLLNLIDLIKFVIICEM